MGFPFSDAVVEAIVAAAGGTAPADPTAIAAVEAAAGLYARCLAGASVTDATGSAAPSVVALIARDLIRRGESVHLIEVDRGRVVLIPAGSWGRPRRMAGTPLVVSAGPVRTVRERHPVCSLPPSDPRPIRG